MLGARAVTEDEVIEEMQQWTAILASVLSPAEAAARLRQMADEIEAMQPVAN
jgi:hypothetical protein